jgi:hypothetical protein
VCDAHDSKRLLVLILILVLTVGTTAGVASSLDLDLDDIAFAAKQRRGDGWKEERSDVGLRENDKWVVEYWYARAKVLVVVVKVEAVITRRRKRATTFHR